MRIDRKKPSPKLSGFDLQGPRNAAIGRIMMQSEDNDPSKQMDEELPAFLWAAKTGDLEALSRGIGLGLINAANAAGNTALMIASAAGNVEAVKALLDAEGIDVDARNAMGRTALFLIAMHGAVYGESAEERECARLIIPRANVSAEDCSGRTPLLWATGCKSEELAKLILAKDPLAIQNRCGKTGRTPLGEACARPASESLVNILAKTSQMNVCDNEGMSPLGIAARFSSATIMKIVLASSDVEARDKQGRTPLMLAMIGPDNIEKLAALESLCDMDAVDNDGNTALMWACMRPVQSFEEAWSNSGPDELATRLRARCNPLARNKNNEDALALAAKEGRGSCILALADAGGAPLRDNFGYTPLMSLSGRGMDSLGASGEMAEHLMMACALALAERCDISEVSFAGRSAENNAWLQGNDALAIRLEALALAQQEKKQLLSSTKAPASKTESRGPKRAL